MKVFIKNNTYLYFWLVMSFAYAITDSQIMMIAGYFLYLCVRIAQKGIAINDKFLIELIIMSILIPNNYLVIAVIDVLSIIIISTKKMKKTQKKFQKEIKCLCYVLLAYAVINGIIHSTPLMNYIWAFLYFSPLFASVAIMKRITYTTDLKNWLIEFLKFTIILQVIRICLYGILNFNRLRYWNDLDWVSGTFGERQGNVFFVYCAFCSFVFLERYIKTKNRETLPYFILCLLMLVGTGSVGMTLLYGLSIIVVMLTSNRVKGKYKLMLIIGSILSAVLFVAFNPSWVTRDLLGMLNYDSFIYKIRKALVYKNVFIERPQKDLLFGMFGCGFGQGTSRTALTGTGVYIKNIGLFTSSSFQSDFFVETVYPYIKDYLTGKVGLAAAPVATILSVQSELGYVGTVLFLIIFFFLCREKNVFVKLVCYFELLSFLWENYLEYPKCVFMFILSLFLFGYWIEKQNGVQVIEDISTIKIFIKEG